jgi:two-component system sensor histidine kinase CpxA
MPTSPEPAPIRGVRFPLSAKILLWFFVNLAFLGATAWVFARAQLHLGLDSLLAGPVNDRLETMASILSAQLNERPQAEWPATLAGTAGAYRVQLALFRNDGRRLAGDIDPPAEVLNRLLDFRDPRPKPGLPDGARDRPPNAPRDGDPPNRPLREPPPFRGEQRPERPPLPGQENQPPRPRDGPPPLPPAMKGGFPKMMLHTTNPRLYWVLIRMPVVDREQRPPSPATLVLATDSLRAGGLLFDYTPWLFAGGLVLVISVLLWLPLVVGITRALRQMTGAAEAIAQGRFETQVHARRADELGRLASAINHMSARLREFFTGQKRFLGDIAHELCSPLARMEMALGILDQRADEKQQAYVTDVREELSQMSGLVHELLSFSKAGVGGKNVELKPVPLAELTGRVVTRECKDRSGIVVDIPGDLSALAEPELLARALGNVVRNALRYAAPAYSGGDAYSYRPTLQSDGRPAGPITVSARSDSERIIMSIADCGPGVPEEALHRLFDPFFRPESARTRETGGAGLGLAIVKSCIEACGGTVTARNVSPRGLQIDFHLSRADR